jgi:hypothetical protein
MGEIFLSSKCKSDGQPNKRRICFFYEQNVKNIFKLLISVEMKLVGILMQKISHHGDLKYYKTLTNWFKHKLYHIKLYQVHLTMSGTPTHIVGGDGH